MLVLKIMLLWIPVTVAIRYLCLFIYGTNLIFQILFIFMEAANNIKALTATAPLYYKLGRKLNTNILKCLDYLS